MSVTINGAEKRFPGGFAFAAAAVIQKADLDGDFEFIATGKDRFICKQTVTLDIVERESEIYDSKIGTGLVSKIVSYFDFCANTITTSHFRRTSRGFSESGTTVDTINPLSILAYNSLPENNPYRRDMDVLKKALDAGLGAGP